MSLLYTIGYGGVSWPSFVDALSKAEVEMVIDCRHAPHSKSSPHYCKEALTETLPEEGLGYQHMPELGNPHYQAGTLEPYREHLRSHPATILSRLLSLLKSGRCLCLLCGCPRPDQCHRGVITEYLQQTDPALQVRHLRPPQGEARSGPAPRILGLTLHQPWAWAIVHGPKRVENRTWRPTCPIGTYLAIHAGKVYDREGARWIWQTFRLSLPTIVPEMAVVGVARLAGVVEQSDDPWFGGPVGWVLDQVVPLQQPVPGKGKQGLWRLDEPVLQAVRAGWRASKQEGQR